MSCIIISAAHDSEPQRVASPFRVEDLHLRLGTGLARRTGCPAIPGRGTGSRGGSISSCVEMKNRGVIKRECTPPGWIIASWQSPAVLHRDLVSQ